METFYFGGARGPLFGCHHPPRPGSQAGGVLILNPTGHEYFHAHRAVRQLAQRLSDKGCAVLRFDYYGCGDSGGDAAEASLQRWLSDAGIALEELRCRAGDGPLHAVGLRVGASLAARFGAAGHRFSSLALWDPVVRGSDWLRESLALHRSRWGAAEPAELLGQPLPAKLREELDELDLRALTAPPADRVLLIDTRGDPAQRDLAAHLEALGCRVESRAADGAELWSGEAHKAVIPGTLMQDLTRWITQT